MMKSKIPKYPKKTRGLGQSPKPAAGAKKGATQLAWDSFYESWAKIEGREPIHFNDWDEFLKSTNNT